MEELIFHWGLEGYSSKLYRISDNHTVSFINRHSSMDFDENDNEVWRKGEQEFLSFEEYWTNFVSREHWLHYQPDFFTQRFYPLCPGVLFD